MDITKIKNILLLFILLLSSCISNEVSNLQKVPFLYKQEHIYIETSHKQNNYNFMFDTGAESCIIDTSLKSIFDNPVEEEGLFNGIKVPVFHDELTIGKNTVKHLLISIYNFKQWDFMNLDGIIGLPYFANFVLGIDYINSDLIFGFTQEDLIHYFDDHNFKEISTIYNGYGKLFHVEVYVKGKAYPALIDTGSWNSMIPENLAMEIGKSDPKQVRESKVVKELQGFMIGNLRNTTETNHYINVKELTFGDSKYTNLSFQNWSQDFFLLGNDFLKNFTWIYDYENRRILVRNELQNDNELKLTEYLTFGYDIYKYNHGDLIVKEVIINSEVWNKGLRPNMKIIKINDNEITGLNDPEIIKSMYNYNLENIKSLTIESDKGSRLETIRL